MSDVLGIELLKDVGHPTDIYSVVELSSDYNPVPLTLDAEEATQHLASRSWTNWAYFFQQIG